MKHSLDPSHIMQTATAFWASKVLLTAVELDVFSALDDAPMTASQLGKHLGLHPRGTYDFFDALVALHFLSRDGDGPDGKYKNTPETAAFLSKSRATYIGGLPEMLNSRLFGFWNHLGTALKTGQPQNEMRINGKPIFEELYANEDRLGESSQEIGDIVSLINDIADQTNILSLNAAIQASMAGDAGRGFAVVADEVQRLAERSSAATKQIEALVKTIQSDTNEAVISMEHTTAEVVRGARLAQDAGIALEEIENVSMSLAELIQNISNAARQQSSSAAHISNTMNVIQEITSQTSSGTNATAKSIGNLAEMASELRSSVAGFTLPEEDVAEQEEEEDSDVPVVG